MVILSEVITEDEKTSGPDYERTIFSVGLVAVNPEKVLVIREESKLGVAQFTEQASRWKGGVIPREITPGMEFTTIWLAHNYSTLTIIGSPQQVITALNP
tara:strand:- start:652 stop:951 length:300 start_codon:yes stop_codon:yes gene_type:complete